METILITGANRGIGLELTKQFLAGGASVIATCRAPDAAADLHHLRQSTSNLTMETLDVTDEASVNRLAVALDGVPINVLINNAGVMGGDHQSLNDMDFAAWRDTLEINTMAPFRMAAAFLPNLRSAQKARLVTISSQMGALNRQSTGAHIYRSSKAAVNKVMQVLALELKQDGIVVCPVHPGWVRTDMGGH